MQIGVIGLGRMGASMVTRLLRGGHNCVVHDRSPQGIERLWICPRLPKSGVAAA